MGQFDVNVKSLLYGMYFALDRLRDTSKKFAIFLLASIVILRQCLPKTLQRSFLNLLDRFLKCHKSL